MAVASKLFAASRLIPVFGLQSIVFTRQTGFKRRYTHLEKLASNSECRVPCAHPPNKARVIFNDYWNRAHLDTATVYARLRRTTDGDFA
jgi:hypothetical protein